MKKEVLNKHRAKFLERQPEWAETKRDKQRADEDNQKYPIRKQDGKYIRSSSFIMEVVHKILSEEIAKAFEKLTHILSSFRRTEDPHLVQPYLSIKERAGELAEDGDARLLHELAILCAHVKKMKAAHKSKIGVGQDFTRKPIEVRQDILRGLSLSFSLPNLLDELKSNPVPRENPAKRPISMLLAMSDAEAEIVMASYAYQYDWQVAGGTRFPFDVAFSALCSIKASAEGKATILRDFYLKFGVHRSYRPVGV